MSEQGDKARKALHDMRWGPHIDDPVERQEIMDDAIKVALGTVSALELERDSLQAALDINDGFVTGVEDRLEKAEARLSKMEEALERYGSHLPECWKNASVRELGVGGSLASCTCGYSELIQPVEIPEEEA